MAPPPAKTDNADSNATHSSPESDKPSPSLARIVSCSPLPSASAKWLSLHSTTYLDPTGARRTWEHAERLTRPTTSPIDSVGIIALFVNHPPDAPTDPRAPSPTHGPKILLQRQFRPPAGAVCIEVPAGLVDAADAGDIEAAALRELREETGYVGVVASEPSWRATPVMFPDPGLTGTNTVMVHVTVDLADPRNVRPRPRLEAGEFVESFVVPLAGLWEECRRLEGEGCVIDGRVGSLAEGVEMARRCRLWEVG